MACWLLWLYTKCTSYVLSPSDAPASPSTQEAIQGMLCMANLQSSSSSPGAGLQAWLAAGHERSSAGASGTKRSGKRALKRPAHHSTDNEEEASMDEQESLGACFKDAEYSKEWDKEREGSLCRKKMQGKEAGFSSVCLVRDLKRSHKAISVCIHATAYEIWVQVFYIKMRLNTLLSAVLYALS